MTLRVVLLSLPYQPPIPLRSLRHGYSCECSASTSGWPRLNGGTHRPSHSREGRVRLNAMGQLRVEMHRVEDRGAERSTDAPCLVRTDRASTREPSTTPSSLEAVAFTATSGRRSSAQEDQRFSVHIDDDLLSAHWWAGVASLLRHAVSRSGGFRWIWRFPRSGGSHGCSG